MKTIWIILLFNLFVGCSQKKPEASIVTEFWDAMAAKDVEAVKPLLSNSEAAEFIEGAEIKLTMDDYKILGSVEKGVNVQFSSTCLTDYVTPTVVVTTDNGPRVDFMQTLVLAMKAQAKAKPKKRYCYDLADQPMQGEINGKPWEAHHINRAIYDFGTKKSEELNIVSEPCQDKWCNGLKSPSLLISNLDLSGAGGNFDMKNNITLFIPPDSNQIITEGSYRVSTMTESRTKLEISFHQNEGTAVNGFILYSADDTKVGS